MSTTPKLLAQASLTATNATYYTVPGGYKAALTLLAFCNTGAVTATIDLYFVSSGGTIGVASTIFKGKSLQPGETFVYDTRTVLESGHTLQASASVAGIVSMLASGMEFDPSSAGSTSTPTPQVRQTVLAGSVDTNGQANFLQVGTGLSVNLLATSVPVVMTFAAGFNAQGPVDYTAAVALDRAGAWGGLPASSTAFLYVDRDPASGVLGYGYSIIAPTYSPAPKTPAAPNKITPNLTGNNAPAPYVVTASNDAANAWKLFNGTAATNETGAWNVSGNSAATDWVVIDLGAPKILAYYTITPYISDRNYAPSGWLIEGSNTGAFTGEQVAIDTRSSSQPTSVRQRFDLSPYTTSYRYYRYKVTALASSFGPVLSEIEFFGVASASDNAHWFDLNAFVMKVWDGAAWSPTPVQRLFIGEAVTNGTGVTSVISYALLGQYDSGWFTVAINTPYQKACNIGQNPDLYGIEGLFRENQSYPSIRLRSTAYNGASWVGVNIGMVDRNTVKVRTQALLGMFDQKSWGATNPSGGNYPSTGEYRMIVSRGW